MLLTDLYDVEATAELLPGRWNANIAPAAFIVATVNPSRWTATTEDD